MRDPGIGRVLVASLHQGIADLIPTRLDFYENWLSPEGFREGSIGPAPLTAVLSFLRQEGEAYFRVMERSGQYAADWTVEAMTPFRRATVHAMPQWVRRRVVLGVARRMVRETYQASRATSRLRKGVAQITVKGAVFCTVREPVAQPLCGYYSAAFARLLSWFHLHGQIETLACRGTGEGTCIIAITFSKVQPETDGSDVVG